MLTVNLAKQTQNDVLDYTVGKGILSSTSSGREVKGVGNITLAMQGKSKIVRVHEASWL